jgi:hypothetical protein
MDSDECHQNQDIHQDHWVQDMIIWQSRGNKGNDIWGFMISCIEWIMTINMKSMWRWINDQDGVHWGTQRWSLLGPWVDRKLINY